MKTYAFLDYILWITARALVPLITLSIYPNKKYQEVKIYVLLYDDVCIIYKIIDLVEQSKYMYTSVLHKLYDNVSSRIWWNYSTYVQRLPKLFCKLRKNYNKNYNIHDN